MAHALIIDLVAEAFCLAIILGAIAIVLTQETRRRWRRKAVARGRPVEAFLGDCVPPESER